MLAAGLLTPSELFYVRNHLPVPDIDPKAWRLRVEGEVRAVRATALPITDPLVRMGAKPPLPFAPSPCSLACLLPSFLNAAQNIAPSMRLACAKP
eukprot:96223-Chlamydomonas_euryale.AAC.1